MPKYFIYAVATGPSGIETPFNTEIERDEPIRSIQDIYQIQQQIKRRDQHYVIIKNWKRFEKPELDGFEFLDWVKQITDAYLATRGDRKTLDPLDSLTESKLEELAAIEDEFGPENGIFAAGSSLSDLREAIAAREEAKAEGVVSWEQLKEELNLNDTDD